MGDLRTVLRTVRAPVLVVASVALGLQFPAPETAAALTTPLVALLVFTAVHGRGRQLFASGRPQFTAWALVLVYAVPAAFAPAVTMLLDGPARVGTLVMLAGPPTAGSAIVWSRFGGGDETATALLTTVAVAVAPLATPGLLAVVLGRGVAVDPFPVVRELLVVVGGGLCLAWLVPDDAVGPNALDTLSLGAVAVLVYVGTATTAFGRVAGFSLAVVGLLAIGFLALTAAVAVALVPIVGQDRAVSLFFGIGLRNLGIGVAVATTLPVDGAVAAVVAFYAVQQFVAAVAAQRLRASPASSARRPRSVDD